MKRFSGLLTLLSLVLLTAAPKPHVGRIRSLLETCECPTSLVLGARLRCNLARRCLAFGARSFTA